MRTPRASPPTKQRLLAAAQRLMLGKGYPATTLDEICLAAGVTKGSFFHYFADKEHLGMAVLDHFVAGQFQTMQAAPFHTKRDPLERVYGYIDFMIKMSKDPSTVQGCLLGSFAQDISETHPKIRARCGQHFDSWANAFKQDLDAAKKKHAPRASFDTQSLSEHFIAVAEGALILVKVKRDEKILGKQLRHFKRYLQSLFSGKA